MPDEVTTRIVERDEVTPDFLQAAAGLLDRAFDGWPPIDLSVSAADHLAWKVNGPLPGFPSAIVAELDGQIAGYRTALVRRVRVKGNPRLFMHFVDASVDPRFQGRGANRATQQLMHDHFNPLYDLAIDDSVNPHMIRGRARLGSPHEFGNRVRSFVLPLDASRLVRLDAGGRMPASFATLRVRGASGAIRLAARLTARPRGGHAADCSIRTVNAFDARFDAFCDEASAQFDLIPERTAAFLNWRYADPRAGRFTIRIAERDDDDLLGYLVTTGAHQITTVADILVAPHEPSVANALVDDAVRGGRAAGSAAVSCWLPQRHPYRAALRASGFVALGGPASLVYRAVSMPEEELAFLGDRDASWHFTHGDTDFI